MPLDPVVCAFGWKTSFSKAAQKNFIKRKPNSRVKETRENLGGAVAEVFERF